MELNWGLQARLRQLFGSRGGPALSGADFLQPAAVVASAEGPFRNPAFEFGEGIKRQWVGNAPGTATALRFATAFVGALATGGPGLVHVREVGITMGSSATQILIGRAAFAAGLTVTDAHFTDVRLPFVDITSQVSIRGGDLAAASTFLGARNIIIAPFTTIIIEVDYSLVLTPAQDVLMVQAETANTSFQCWFAGELYDFGAGSR